jgi:hypothetical protein
VTERCKSSPYYQFLRDRCASLFDLVYRLTGEPGPNLLVALRKPAHAASPS